MSFCQMRRLPEYDARQVKNLHWQEPETHRLSFSRHFLQVELLSKRKYLYLLLCMGIWLTFQYDNNLFFFSCSVRILWYSENWKTRIEWLITDSTTGYWSLSSESTLLFTLMNHNIQRTYRASKPPHNRDNLTTVKTQRTTSPGARHHRTPKRSICLRLNGSELSPAWPPHSLGCSWAIYEIKWVNLVFGWVVCIHMNTRTQGFPAEYCIVRSC